MCTARAEFRFYAELNDFLPPERRGAAFSHAFRGTPTVKDVLQALGVPHTEVELILVDGRSVGFDQRLCGGERVAAYPVFESFHIGPMVRLRAAPLRYTRFLLDGHLGKLARLLRLLGFDTHYARDLEDAAIVDLAAVEGRIILTRDRDLLKRSKVTHGYWLRAADPWKQAVEVVVRFDLTMDARPFTRCLACNGALRQVEKACVLPQLPEAVARSYERFTICTRCGRVYWAGTHHARLRQQAAELLRLGRQAKQAQRNPRGMPKGRKRHEDLLDLQ